MICTHHISGRTDLKAAHQPFKQSCSSEPSSAIVAGLMQYHLVGVKLQCVSMLHQSG